MATHEPEMPHTRKGAGEKSRTEDVPRRQPETEERPRRSAGDETGTHGDRMPKGADEPGAGL